MIDSFDKDTFWPVSTIEPLLFYTPYTEAPYVGKSSFRVIIFNRKKDIH